MSELGTSLRGSVKQASPNPIEFDIFLLQEINVVLIENGDTTKQPTPHEVEEITDLDNYVSMIGN